MKKEEILLRLQVIVEISEDMTEDEASKAIEERIKAFLYEPGIKIMAVRTVK